MSSINPHYTFQYSQPEEYRFSHDSVFLARGVFEMVRDEIKPDWRVLDLCAGCGIVGLDFLFHCKKELNLEPVTCDFLEVQSVYKDHFETNRKQLRNDRTEMRFLNQNYNNSLEGTYDLILCNPPYFDPAESQLSPSEFKNRCRFFIDATQDELIKAIERWLAPNGKSYVLTRGKKPASPALCCTQVGDVRNTPLLLYQKA